MENTAPTVSVQIPRDLYYQIVHSLRGALPPPVGDDPADLVRRDNAMIACVASLMPGNANEASIAVQCVAADAQALDCLRLARTCGDNVLLALRCSAQAAGMMRQARGARTVLLRLQASRQERKADDASLGHAPPPQVAEPEPPTTKLTEAERYAMTHPRRATLMRSLGGLPAKCDFAPPSRALVRAIVRSDSPILRALDPQIAAAA